MVADYNLNNNGQLKNGETVEISKSFLSAQGLADAIKVDAKNQSQSDVDQNGRTLKIDGKGDSITFLSGDKLDASHFKLV